MSRPADEPSRAFRFAVGDLDRRSDLRDDDAAIAALFERPDARFVVLAGDRPLVAAADGGRPATALHERRTATRLAGALECETTIFLGLSEADGAPRFALRSRLDDEALAAHGEVTAADLRALAISGELEATEYGAIATARGMLHWHASHGFCARCGATSRIAAAGWKRVCPACAAEHFPRTDPVVIMLVADGDRCLLGRSARFAPGMWSCLAGFMEPGETVEAAVRRETMEEAGITVGRVEYFASEPWPFPGSLMIGVLAEATTTDVRRDEAELEDCRWFGRAEATALLDRSHPDGLFAPPPIAIAHHLLAAWCRRTEG